MTDRNIFDSMEVSKQNITMSTTHVVPVGFDYDRLIAPLSRGELDADKVVLITGEESAGSTATRSFADTIRQRLARDLEVLVGVEPDTRSFANLHDFESIYADAYELITELAADGSEVWVNVSSAPRPVAFGFSSVIHTLVADTPERRGDFHLYYVIPEEYLVTEMIEQLDQTEEELRGLIRELSEYIGQGAREGRSPSEVLQPVVDGLIARREALDELVDTVDRAGVSQGATPFDGRRYVELPLALLPGLRSARARSGLGVTELKVLQVLADGGPADSVAKVADRISDLDPSEQPGQSLRSKVQYNVVQLEQKGFVSREKRGAGRGHRTQLSPMGKLWVDANDLDRLIAEARDQRRRSRAE